MEEARVWVIQKRRAVASDYLSEWPTIAERVFTKGAVDSSAEMHLRTRRDCESWLADKGRDVTAHWRLLNRETQETVPWEAGISD